jgi:hypothetical protein
MTNSIPEESWLALPKTENSQGQENGLAAI